MRYWLAILGLVMPAAALAQPGPLSGANCQTPEHMQFDFWVGRWNVFRSDTNAKVAESRIEKLYGGCAIRENWMPTGGTGGGSLNSWRAGDRKWRQYWVDSGGNLNIYSGGLVDGAMVITGTSENAAGVSSPIRITYKRGGNGEVYQIGESSSDGGKSWQLTYHFTYRPATAAKGNSPTGS